LMDDLKIGPPFCTLHAALSDCGFKTGATFYFVSYLLLESYSVTNLFVALIIDNVGFGLLNTKSIITPADLEHYQVRVAGFDRGMDEST
jgi:hypothetical protein